MRRVWFRLSEVEGRHHAGPTPEFLTEQVWVGSEPLHHLFLVMLAPLVLLRTSLEEHWARACHSK